MSSRTWVKHNLHHTLSSGRGDPRRAPKQSSPTAFIPLLRCDRSLWARHGHGTGYSPHHHPLPRMLLSQEGSNCRWGSARDISAFTWFLHEMFYLGAVLALPPQRAHATSQGLIMSLHPSHFSRAERGDRADTPSLSFSGTWYFFLLFFF